MKFIVRVDDVGQDVDQSKVDHGLQTFAKWYECWKGLPVYCGVVAGVVTRNEMQWLWDNMPLNFIALHGWKHDKRNLTREDIFLGLEMFPQSHVVIPPYNLYDDETILAMKKEITSPRPTLLGGFYRKDHHLGMEPIFRDGVLHLSVGKFASSVDRHCYAKSYELADWLLSEDQVMHFRDPWPEHPVQMVLHHRWDAGHLDGVRRLRDRIANQMVTIDDAWKWAETH